MTVLWILCGAFLAVVALGFALGWYVRGAYTLRYITRVLRRRKERA